MIKANELNCLSNKQLSLSYMRALYFSSFLTVKSHFPQFKGPNRKELLFAIMYREYLRMIIFQM